MNPLPILFALLTSSILAFGAMPDFRRLPGHLVMGQCDAFSKAAVTRLRAEGIPARRVLYRFSRFGSGITTWHAAVLFEWKGKRYFMDNQHRFPVPVAGKTDLGCIHHAHEGDFFASMTDESGNRIKPRRVEDLLRGIH